MEFQIEDRRSFQRFMGLSDAKRALSRNSFRQFRESLTELKLTETLFNEFNRQLDRAGLIARKGQLIWVAQRGGNTFRCVGLTRVEVRIDFMNLVYKMRCFSPSTA